MFAHFKQIAAPMSHFPRNYKKAKGSSKLSDDTGHCDCNSGSKLPQFSVFLQVQWVIENETEKIPNIREHIMQLL